MRKTIETLSTLILWIIWILGSELAISEIINSPTAYKKVIEHLWIVSWSPAIAISVFSFMMVAVWLSKDSTDKKPIPNQHTIKWTDEDILSAQSGKFVDLHFAGSGLDCNVLTRGELAMNPEASETTVREHAN